MRTTVIEKGHIEGYLSHNTQSHRSIIMPHHDIALKIPWASNCTHSCCNKSSAMMFEDYGKIHYKVMLNSWNHELHVFI